jgi:5-hydroxyisourate hydrolase
MGAITTHVLDTSRGQPAAYVPVALDRQNERGGWEPIGRGETDLDGRLRSLMPAEANLFPGTYRLIFDVAGYFSSHGVRAFYPAVTIVFEAAEGESHYHVPLLLSPFAYSTYRGS